MPVRIVRTHVNRLGNVLRRTFEHRIVYAWERPSIMRKHIYTGMMGSIYFTVVSGLFFVYFGNTIGMTCFQWGLMAAVSSLMLAVQLPSALVTQRQGHRKLIWFCSAMLDRLARLAGIAVAAWLWHRGSSHAAAALIVGICAASFFGALAMPPWYSWLADLIPEQDHGGFWGRRSAWLAFAIACTVVPAGVVVDYAPEQWRPYVVVGMFAVASVIGTVDLLIHNTLPEPCLDVGEPARVLTQLLAPLRDRRFRPWLAFNTCWTFGMTLGGALATVYFVEDLGIKRNFLGGSVVITVFSLAGGMLTSAWTGRMVDRHGPRRVLLWGHVFWACLPLFWVLATPASALVWLGCGSLVAGVASNAGLTAANKLITRFPPPRDRAMYVAVSSCLGSLAGGAGAFAAGILLDASVGWTFRVGSYPCGAFHALFLASFCLRMASAVFLCRRVQNP